MSQLAITDRLSALPAETGVRLALKLDAVVTGANGFAYLAAASLLDGPLGMPASFLRGVGAFLLVFAAAVWVVLQAIVVGGFAALQGAALRRVVRM